MRRALLSVAIGLAGAAVVAASGWALQAGALPPPTPAARVAAAASAWFHEYRLVVDVFHFDRRRTTGACLRGWYGRADGHKARGSLLSVDSKSVLRISGRRRISLVQGRPSRPVPALLAAEAGCSRQLAAVLATAAQSGTHLTVSRGDAANRAAIALKISRGNERRLTLYVSPRSYRPLVSIVALGEREATARLYLTRARPHLLAHFHLLRLAEPGPRR